MFSFSLNVVLHIYEGAYSSGTEFDFPEYERVVRVSIMN